MAKVGRPTKLTEETINKLLGHIREGLPLMTSCALSGLSHVTMYDWLNKAETEEQKRQELSIKEVLTEEETEYLQSEESNFLNFLRCYREALADAERRLVLSVQTDKSWQAKTWILERRYAHHWSKVDKQVVQQEVTVSGGVNHTLTLSERIDKYAELFNAEDKPNTEQNTTES